jgi:UDP-N-acetylmuramate dehydrogenase
MNAGGRFGTVGDALLEVCGVDEDGRPFRRAVVPSDLGYRRTAFEGSVLLSARFRRDPTLDVASQRRLLDEALRWKQATQPLSARSAGCIFKNPSGPGASPSAGRLIEEAGLKGQRVGGAEVSAVHANFIVNSGRATAGDVFALIDLVRGAVLARHGLPLDLEVRVWS